MKKVSYVRFFLAIYIVVMLTGRAFETWALELNSNPPDQAVRLIFIHHSTGENWLADENGGLGVSLRDNNYFVSDTNYAWGPDIIGDSTDIGHWWLWFRGTNSSTYMNALYNEGDQHSSYSRISAAPSGENEIIMFKSCFPNSGLLGNANDAVPSINSNPLRGEGSGSEYHTVANAKGIFIDLLEYFRTRQDKLFILITAPPLSDPTYAYNARVFNNWLLKYWLSNYPYKNVAVFDFYNVLTTNGGNTNTNDLNQETGNHHRLRNTTVQHKTDGDDDSDPNVLEYPASQGDDHPSQAGNLKATGEFISLLNIYYHCWKGTGACPSLSLFDDVPESHWAYGYIRAIYSNGITTGCSQNPLMYCPTYNVARDQMATFIVRAKEGEPAQDYCSSDSPFSDVDTNHWACKYIRRLYELGITTGCGLNPLIYCPDTYVTRGQMAAFIIRAKFGESFSYTTTPYFSDVPATHNFFKYVQKLKDVGITAVTGTYGVDTIVPRDQMAAFLARAFLGMQ